MEQIEQVNEVLREIGADHIPQILVWNKIDAAGLEPGVERDEYDKISRVFISAHSGAGLDLLRDAIVEAARSEPGLTHADEQDTEEPGFARDVQPGIGGPADGIPVTTPAGPH
jgi:GTP-binding protein HflX